VRQGLSEAVESVSICADGDALVAALSALDVLESKICAAVGEFDASGLYEADGATSALAWLRNHGRLSGPGPRRWCARRAGCARSR
jgi:hypothetical protein